MFFSVLKHWDVFFLIIIILKLKNYKMGFMPSCNDCEMFGSLINLDRHHLRGSYLQEMPTNIAHLDTAGLLNSRANRFTTTNVGHITGNPSSVISLSELNLDSFIRNHSVHFTKAQAAAMEAKADAVESSAEAKVNANTKLSDAQKAKLIAALKLDDSKFHMFVDAHTAAQLQQLY